MRLVKAVIGIIFLVLMTLTAYTDEKDYQDISLSMPRMQGGKPLFQALKERQSSRAFSARQLPDQLLADLLWAAFGINRLESDKRTAPSAKNWQEIEIYVVMEKGTYVYDPKLNILKALIKEDLRKLTGHQDFVETAPVNLVYVADTSKMTGASPEDQVIYSAADTGFVSQNVYLFCASEGLVTVVRGSVDRKTLSQTLGLPSHKKIILAQTVGYPKENTK
ncbi:MAG: nitroreductase family protein [Proteobacteria bacterium]|nr:nitroreductase family protein [Pseudomonadota bacterium]